MAWLLIVIASFFLSINTRAANDTNILWSVDWSSDGKWFAVGGAWVGIFDAETQLRTRHSALDSLKAVAKVRWHPRRNLLAISGGTDGVTAIYDPAAAERMITLKTKEGTRGIAWNATGDLLATAGNGGEMQIWRANGQLLHETRPAHAKSLTGVAWHPQQNKIITVGEFITSYDGQGKITHQVRHRPGTKGLMLLLCVEWHPSGEFFVVGDYGNSESAEAPALQLWSSDCKLLKSIEVNGGAPFRNVAWSRDGTQLASASDALRIWSKDGQLRYLGKSPDHLWGVRWNPEGHRLLTSSQDGRVTFWSASAEVLTVMSP